jgi:hypothetical protein
MMNAIYFIDIAYANAFRSLGHSVYFLKYGDKLPDPQQFIPDVSISCFHIAYSEKTDYVGLRCFQTEYGTKIVIWGSPFGVPAEKYTDEHTGLHPERHLELMKSGMFDLCISYYCREGIEMYYRIWTDDFGIPVLSLPFAADTTVFRPCPPEAKLQADLCFIGGIHRTKKRPFYDYIRPLLDRFTMAVAGRGWDEWPVTKVTLEYGEESRLISSCSVAPNIHMDLSREVPGMPVNMRTFQCIAGGGFVISDNVPSLRNYFSEQEVPIGRTPKDYQEKVHYFTSHREERNQYRLRAYRRLRHEHTYKHRVLTLLKALSTE